MHADSTVLAGRLLRRARLRHVQALIAICELGSLMRASDALGMTQPSLTHALADLESLLGQPLFQRHARGVSPLPIALALLPYARRILGAVHDCAEVTAALSTKANTVIRIAAITSAVSGLLTRVLHPFGQRHPGILLTVQEVDVREIGDLIAQDGTDVALCRQPPVLPEGWCFEPLLEDRYIVVAGPTHPLAHRQSLDICDLFAEAWIVVPAPSAPRAAFDQLVSGHPDWSPHVLPLATRSQLIVQSLLQQERLLTILPQSMVRHALHTQQLMRLDVALPLDCEPLGMLRPVAEAGPAAAAFQDYLRGGDWRAGD